MTRDDPAAFAPPPAFGPFRVLHQIGIGALGPVFRTYEPTRDRLVAVKLFRLDITPEQAQSLVDELARACDAGLFHPSIVEPIAAGVEGTAAYRAEEYVAAESLDVAIRHYAPASLDKALPFITQLAGAIDFARTAGVGHGGLHLRDVFVTPEEARASGFGIVESLERVAIRAPVRRPYSAPERIAGAAWSTPADVFSLAAIGYELLTGRRPSGTGDQIGTLAGENVGEHAAALRAVLARAMDEDSSRRYSTALAFASALEAAARGAGATDTGLAAGAISGVERAGAEHVPDAAAPHLESAVETPVPIAVTPVPAQEEPVEIPAPPEIEIKDVDADLDTEPPPTLFDAADKEPLDDLAINEPSLRSEEPPKWQYEPTQETGAPEAREEFTEPERTRMPMVPVALGVLIGVLIGLAGGYALANRGRSDTTQQTTNVATAQPAAPAPSTASQPQRSGRAWSEQSVAQPSAAGRSTSAAAPSDRAGRGGRPGASPPPVPGEAPAAARPGARATRATLMVESTPKNAPVTVNGIWRGRTPLTIDDLGFGTYTLRIVQPGYAVAREVVTLSRAQPSRTVVFRLQRPTATAAAAPQTQAPRSGATAQKFSGSLFVASNPPGARVFIDGRAVGTAPARIPEVPIGSHVVRLELPDHRIWSTSTRIARGQETRVTGSLERIQ